MKRIIIPAAVALTLGLTAGTASANAFTADATCAGFTLDMPRTEDGTVVTLTANGRTVRTDTVTVFGDPVRYTVASPDPTVPQAWRLTVDSQYGTDQTYTETVPACVAVTTTAAPTTTTVTTVPTSSVPTVAVTMPPVPRPSVPPSTDTATTVPFALPETGRAFDAMLILATMCAGFGGMLLWVRRGDRS